MEIFGDIKNVKNYKIIANIGRGAIGNVFKAFNSQTGELVAIKHIKLSSLHQNLETRKKKSFKTEIKFLKFLNHPNIVKLLDFTEDSYYLNLILEYMENGSLSSLISTMKKINGNRTNLDENLIKGIILQILHGLEYLHSNKIIHRDIKGANILLDKSGCVKVTDFGVAKLLQNELKENHQNSFVGTPYWMAPEMINSDEGTQITVSSDIWSVGCTILECLTGSPPYADLEHYQAFYKIVKEDHPPFPENISKECLDVLIQCFNKNPKQRPSAKELIAHRWFSDVSALYKPIIEKKKVDNIAVNKQYINFIENNKSGVSVYNETDYKREEKDNEDDLGNTDYFENLYFQKKITKVEFSYLIKTYFSEGNIENLDPYMDFSFLFSKSKYNPKDMSFVKVQLIKVLYNMINSEKAKEFLDSIISKGILRFVFNLIDLVKQDEEVLCNAAYFIGKAIYIDKKSMMIIINNCKYLLKFLKFIEFDDINEITMNFTTKYNYIIKLGTNCLLEILKEELSCFNLERLLHNNIVDKILLLLNLDIKDKLKNQIDMDLYEILIVIVKKVKNLNHNIQIHYLQDYFCDELVYASIMCQLNKNKDKTNFIIKLLTIIYELSSLSPFRESMEPKGFTTQIIKLIVHYQKKIERSDGLYELNLNTVHILLAIFDNMIGKCHKRKEIVRYIRSIKGLEFLDSLFERNTDKKVRAFILQIMINFRYKEENVLVKINKLNYVSCLSKKMDLTMELRFTIYNFFKTYYHEFEGEFENIGKLYQRFVEELMEKMQDNGDVDKTVKLDLKETMEFLGDQTGNTN